MGATQWRRVELRDGILTLSFPNSKARNHIILSVRDALARQNCTRIVHQTLSRWPDDNPFSLTLPNASVSSYEINQALSEVH